MEILSKDTIKKYIIPHLQVGSCGKRLETDFMVEIVSAILYRLKTGVQWRFLPVQSFFSSKSLTWQGVYYHFREWIKDGSWTQVVKFVATTPPRLRLILCAVRRKSYTL